MSCDARTVRRSLRARGSILIYVLWILAVVGVLAFRLAAVTRSDSLQQTVEVQQLKEQLQLLSALRFARYKIRREQWKGGKYSLNINNREIQIEIINESGFIGLHELGGRSLKKAFNKVEMDLESLLNHENFSDDEDSSIKINDYNELRVVDGVDEEKIWKLSSYISIFNDGPVNPAEAPAEVLMLLSQVDQYRVRRLMEEPDEQERRKLREEIVNLLTTQDTELTDELSAYYRVNISLGRKQYRATIRYDRAERRFKTLALLSGYSTETSTSGH